MFFPESSKEMCVCVKMSTCIFLYTTNLLLFIVVVKWLSSGRECSNQDAATFKENIVKS